MIGFTRIGVIIPDSAPDPLGPDDFNALFAQNKARIVALSIFRPYIHRWLPYPSPQNLYRASEWLASHDELTKYQIFAYFAGIFAICYSILTFTKFVMRASVPWHVSPLATTSLLLHLVGDIQFGQIAQRLNQKTPWSTLLFAPDLLSPFHGPNTYSGPIAYTLMFLGIWEIFTFFVIQLGNLFFRPRVWNFSDFLLFSLTIWLAARSIDPEIELPVIKTRSDGILVRETRAKMEDFQEAVIVSAGFIMACNFAATVISRLVWFIGPKLAWLAVDIVDSAFDAVEAAILRVVDTCNVYLTRRAPAPQNAEPVMLPTPSIPNTVVAIASHSASITARNIDSFFWRQLYMVRRQLQELQAELSSNTADLRFKYNHAIYTLLPIQAVITKVIDIMQSGRTSIDRFELHSEHLQDSLNRMKTSMADLDDHSSNVFGLFKWEPDKDFICNLDDEEKRFWSSLQLEQYDIETSLEGQNDLNRLAKLLVDYTFLFFPQLHNTVESLESMLEHSVNRKLDALCPALDVKEEEEEIRIKQENAVEIKKEDVLRRFQSVTEYEFNTFEALSTTEEITPTATPPTEDASKRVTRSAFDNAAATTFISRTSSSQFFNPQPLLVIDALNASNMSDAETIDLEHDTTVEDVEPVPVAITEEMVTSDDTGDIPSRSAVEEVAALGVTPVVSEQETVAPIEDTMAPIKEAMSTTNTSPTEIEYTETSWVIEDLSEANAASSESAGSQIESPDVSNTSGDETTLCIPIEEATSVPIDVIATSSNDDTPLPTVDMPIITGHQEIDSMESRDDQEVIMETGAVETVIAASASGDKSDNATCSTTEVVAPAVIIDIPPVSLEAPSTPNNVVINAPEPSELQEPTRSATEVMVDVLAEHEEESEVASQDGEEMAAVEHTSYKSERSCEDNARESTLQERPATPPAIGDTVESKRSDSCATVEDLSMRAKSPKPQDHAGSDSAASRSAKGSPDDKVKALWTGITNFEFKQEDILRDPKKAKDETMKADEILSFARLGEYLYCDVRGNRAEMQSASKVVNCLTTYAKEAIGKKNPFNIGTHSLNYLRACIWLGQAYLTRFTADAPTHVFYEIPIEGLIKLSGFGAGAFKTANMLPLPGETWRQYLHRLPTGTEETAEESPDKDKGFLNKAGTMHGLLQRYLGQSPQMLDREVPRAEGWDESSSIDSTLCLKLVMQNLMLLPPYNSTVESTILAWEPKRARTKKEAAEQEAKRKEAVEKGLVEEKVGKKRPKKKKTAGNHPVETDLREEVTSLEA